MPKNLYKYTMTKFGELSSTVLIENAKVTTSKHKYPNRIVKKDTYSNEIYSLTHGYSYYTSDLDQIRYVFDPDNKIRALTYMTLEAPSQDKELEILFSMMDIYKKNYEKELEEAKERLNNFCTNVDDEFNRIVTKYL